MGDSPTACLENCSNPGISQWISHISIADLEFEWETDKHTPTAWYGFTPLWLLFHVSTNGYSQSIELESGQGPNCPVLPPPSATVWAWLNEKGTRKSTVAQSVFVFFLDWKWTCTRTRFCLDVWLCIGIEVPVFSQIQCKPSMKPPC